MFGAVSAAQYRQPTSEGGLFYRGVGVPVLASLPSPPLQLLPVRAIQFPGGFSSSCGAVPFHGAL